jgi:hypothetical protein
MQVHNKQIPDAQAPEITRDPMNICHRPSSRAGLPHARHFPDRLLGATSGAGTAPAPCTAAAPGRRSASATDIKSGDFHPATARRPEDTLTEYRPSGFWVADPRFHSAAHGTAFFGRLRLLSSYRSINR